MSAFRPKQKSVDSKPIRAAYQQRKITRMVANGSTEEHAFRVINAANRAREARADQRRRAREERDREREDSIA